jgi:putative endonuclease
LMADVFFVYVLRSQKTGRRYIGHCERLERRLDQHNSGGTKATQYGKPWVLAYSETFPSIADAVRRELFLKCGQGRELLDRLEV